MDTILTQKTLRNGKGSYRCPICFQENTCSVEGINLVCSQFKKDKPGKILEVRGKPYRHEGNGLFICEDREDIVNPLVEPLNRSEVAEELEGIREYCKPQEGLIPGEIEEALGQVAARMGLSVELFLPDLLAIAGSLLPIGTQLEIDSGTNFYLYPILWTGTVGEVSSLKSPKINVCLSPLLDLQEVAERKYKAKLAKLAKTPLQEGQEPPELPTPRDYYLNDATTEATAQVVGAQTKHGFTIYLDELAGFIGSFNQYRSGKGGDRQRWLSAYDGGAWKYNRKTENLRIHARRTQIAILGTIQNSVLRNLIEADGQVDDGFWSRFAWVKVPSVTPPPPDGNQTHWKIGDLLENLYKRLEKANPRTFTLSPEALSIWQAWHHEIWDETHQTASPILRSLYPKFLARAGRIALISHCINQAWYGTQETILGAPTLSKAISLSRWLLGQSREIYAGFGIVDCQETARILNFCDRFQSAKAIKPKQVRSWWPTKIKPSMREIRAFMTDLVALGYATQSGSSPDAADFSIAIKARSEKP